jgi:hypothetical protein
MTNPNTPRIPDSIDIQRLQAMQLVAKMKESAEKHGIGFIGGFVSPDGQKFVMTNMDDDDTPWHSCRRISSESKRNHHSTLTRPLLVSMSQNMALSPTPNQSNLVHSK